MVGAGWADGLEAKDGKSIRHKVMIDWDTQPGTLCRPGRLVAETSGSGAQAGCIEKPLEWEGPGRAIEVAYQHHFPVSERPSHRSQGFELAVSNRYP